MATFLDLSLLSQFQGVFTWFIVWVIVFGVLEMSKPFGGDHKGLHSLIGVVLAFFVVFSTGARGVVEIALPWFTVLAIGAFFLVFVMTAFGHSPAEVIEHTGKGMRTALIILSVIIVIVALSGALGGNSQPAPPQDDNYSDAPPTGLNPQMGGQQPPPQPQQETFGSMVVRILTHPKVLGMLFILLLANFTIVFLTRTN